MFKLSDVIRITVPSGEMTPEREATIKLVIDAMERKQKR